MDLAMEDGSRLLWQVIVAIDERRASQHSLDALVNIEALIWMLTIHHELTLIVIVLWSTSAIVA